jgi:hypothetical protein
VLWRVSDSNRGHHDFQPVIVGTGILRFAGDSAMAIASDTHRIERIPAGLGHEGRCRGPDGARHF